MDLSKLEERRNQIGTHKTLVMKKGKKTKVRYHDTDVVSFSEGGKKVTLDTGGWKTATTKKRMNQTSDQFDLGYSVSQKKGNWFVDDKVKKRTIAFGGKKKITFHR